MCRANPVGFALGIDNAIARGSPAELYHDLSQGQPDEISFETDNYNRKKTHYRVCATTCLLVNQVHGRNMAII
jgi:hypothetical protein